MQDGRETWHPALHIKRKCQHERILLYHKECSRRTRQTSRSTGKNGRKIWQHHYHLKRWQRWHSCQPRKAACRHEAEHPESGNRKSHHWGFRRSSCTGTHSDFFWRESIRIEQKEEAPMNIWHDIEPERIYPTDFTAVVEISKGSNMKYELDKKTGMLSLDRVLFTATYYPMNYGFIPRTYGNDNDPLDVLILCSAPIQPMTTETFLFGV